MCSSDLKKLVVTTLIDVFFGKCTSTVCLFKSAHSFFSVIGILAGPVVSISHQQPFAVALVVFHHLTVVLGLAQYPFLDFLAFSLDFGSNYIFIYYCPLKHKAESPTS